MYLSLVHDLGIKKQYSNDRGIYAMRKEMLMEVEILELYAGLCREAARCELHALRAVKDNRPELAPLFRSLGESLARQANRFLVQIRGMVSHTDAALQEVYQIIVPDSIAEYEQLSRTADRLGGRALTGGFEQSARIQRKNASLYRQVMKDKQVTEYHVCDFCGYVSRDTSPEHCPICTAPKQRFIRIGVP